jgi:hypothetical protein
MIQWATHGGTLAFELSHMCSISSIFGSFESFPSPFPFSALAFLSFRRLLVQHSSWESGALALALMPSSSSRAFGGQGIPHIFYGSKRRVWVSAIGR